MLHLLPIRHLLTAIIIVIGLVFVAATSLGLMNTGDPISAASLVFRWSSFGAFALVLMSCAGWRWFPFLQNLTFPYLGGEWSGELEFSGLKGIETRQATLTVTHNLFHVKLILDTKESTSRTLVVHPDRDVHLNRKRLYYAFLNERKEGFPGAGDRYRGLAIMRIETADNVTLSGDYFTDESRNGILNLTQDRKHPWWMIWK